MQERELTELTRCGEHEGARKMFKEKTVSAGVHEGA